MIHTPWGQRFRILQRMYGVYSWIKVFWIYMKEIKLREEEIRSEKSRVKKPPPQEPFQDHMRAFFTESTVVSQGSLIPSQVTLYSLLHFAQSHWPLFKYLYTLKILFFFLSKTIKASPPFVKIRDKGACSDISTPFPSDTFDLLYISWPQGNLDFFI